MDERRYMQAIFALAVATVLVLSMLPAVAQAPDDILIKPVAACDAGKCWMSEKDYRQLQTFHAQRIVPRPAPLLDRHRIDVAPQVPLPENSPGRHFRKPAIAPGSPIGPAEARHGP